jgi:L-seryl-tRNA(Ser) seleniumtransferase
LQVHGVEATLWEGESAVGGGSLPGETLRTCLLAVPTENPDRAAAQLRLSSPSVVCRIQKDHLVFDPRTVLPGEEEALLAAIVAVQASAVEGAGHGV